MPETIFHDDFASFPVGAFPCDYSPLAEYHWVDLSGYRGQWYEATIYHQWRDVPNWNAVEEDGSRWMEQSCLRDEHFPMLAAGDFLWSDYTLSARVHPLSDGLMGLAFRYRDSRNFYAFAFEGGELRLIRFAHDDRHVLASCPCPPDGDHTYLFDIEVIGSRIRASADGQYCLEADDDAFRSGKIGLIANAPARFGDIRVTSAPEPYTAYIQARNRQARELDELRERFPKPVLWKRFPTQGFGAGKSVRFADLNGDGRLEILLAQNQKRLDSGNFGMISCLTALTLEGDILWQAGVPNPAHGLLTADVCLQAHDIDRDGHVEVVVTKDFRIRILEGATGKLKAEAPTPYASPRHPRNWLDETAFYRIVGDAIYFCDLEGRGYPQNILLKDRYNTIWAYDHRLEPLWKHSGETGHFPLAYDIDGDGRDEVMAGSTMLSSDGKPLWTLDLRDHMDTIAIGRFGPGDGGDLRILMTAGDEGFLIGDIQGNILKRDRTGHLQKATVADLDPERPGLEYATITFWGEPGVVCIYDHAGNRLTSFEPFAAGSALTAANWTGDGLELLCLAADPRLGGLYDARGRQAVLLPDDGHPTLCCDTLDLCGDARDEIICWDTREVWIYTQSHAFAGNRIYRPKRLPHYNYSNYRADVSLPGWETYPKA
ncbi:MAG: hypothetical protein IT210_25905 [Armatimonadetes bacterium]|nr:hypothetical protein [Armatimonadota bacterium]